MRKKTIYVVTGSSGEYEDYRTWNVFGFTTQSEAEEYAKRCQDAYQTKKELYDKRMEKWFASDGDMKHPEFPKFPLDPFIQHDSGGVSYSWEKLIVLNPQNEKES